jgi:predicted O-methyltransferase YrrM
MIKIIAQDYYDTLIKLYKKLEKVDRALEVGLGWGTSAQAFLNTFENAKLDSIEQADYHGIFEEIQKMYGGRIEIITGRSPEVYGSYAFPMYDYIYIDAAHDYEAVKLDVENTWQYLKLGGIMAFDDYGVEGKTEEGLDHGVKKFVDEYFNNSVPIFLERNIIAFRKG